MFKTLIIGDSLAAQREDDGLLEKERWPLLLSDKISMKVTNLSKGFSTTNRLREKEITNKLSDTDLIIVQLGIVDCAPRRFRRWEMKLLFKLPASIKTPILAFLKKNRKQSVNRAYINLESFIRNIERFYQLAKTPIIFIKILPAGKNFIKINPEISSIIESYNQNIDSLSNRLENFYALGIPKELIPQITLQDGYHLNKNGHEVISEKLQKIITEKVNTFLQSN